MLHPNVPATRLGAFPDLSRLPSTNIDKGNHYLSSTYSSNYIHETHKDNHSHSEKASQAQGQVAGKEQSWDTQPSSPPAGPALKYHSLSPPVPRTHQAGRGWQCGRMGSWTECSLVTYGDSLPSKGVCWCLSNLAPLFLLPPVPVPLH